MLTDANFATLKTEEVQDIIGGMISGNKEKGLTVTYDDVDGKLNFNVNDPVITFVGDLRGSATITNLSNISISTTVLNDSHLHDYSYYTKLQFNAIVDAFLGASLCGGFVFA